MAGAITFQVIADFRENKGGGLPPILAGHFHRIWPTEALLDWPNRSFPRGLVPMMAMSVPREIEPDGHLVWMPSEADARKWG
jgi:hypothetical protein